MVENNKNIHSLTEMETLLKKDVLHKGGNITISISDIPKISHTRDIIGNCIQEWLPQWFEDNGLNLEANTATQKFPDFIAHFDNDKEKSKAVDIKCWNYQQSPSFDIANFDSFYNVVYDNPAKIFAKYLTIGYTPTQHGFRIDYVNLLNLWDIVGKASKYPLSLQVKRGRPYAIRPINFAKCTEKAFKNPLALIQAVKDARLIFPSDTASYDPDDWYNKVKETVDEQNEKAE